MRKRLNDNFILSVVIVLDLTVTVLSLVLGCFMYRSNYLSVMNNRIYVEMTGLISNINYGLHFGKSIESYYGMEPLLKEAVDGTPDVNALYIVTDDNIAVFSDGGKDPDPDVLTLDENEYQKDGSTFYSAFELAGFARLVCCSDMSDALTVWRQYYLHLCIIAAVGFAVSAGIILIIWKSMKDHDRAYRIMLAVLILWIVAISSYVGAGAFKEYNKSIDGIYTAIDSAVSNDLATIRDMKIDDDMITGIDDYLAGYSDNINEIESISYNGGKLEYTPAVSYMRRVAVDYLLQTLLFLAFSIIILAEYQIFMSGIMTGEENDHV